MSIEESAKIIRDIIDVECEYKVRERGAREEAIVRAATQLVALWQEMETSGRAPHTDYWIQSIEERREALKKAVGLLK